MQTQYIGLQMDRDSALECLKGLVRVHVMESEMRMEKGLSPMSQPEVMVRLIKILGLDTAGFSVLADKERENLWEFSWYAFTNEWAWHRAEQEAEKISTANQGKSVGRDMKRLVEKIYRERYDEFVAELEMHQDQNRPSA